jgi:hypothetical protein
LAFPSKALLPNREKGFFVQSRFWKFDGPLTGNHIAVGQQKHTKRFPEFSDFSSDEISDIFPFLGNF